jgi:hypothetical protein
MSIFLVKPPFIYAEKIRIGAASCIMSEMGAVILERIWASINIEFYERSSSISFVSILVLLSWIIGIMCSQLMFYCEFHEVIPDKKIFVENDVILTETVLICKKDQI